MWSHALKSVALTLVAEGKRILAADETVPTLTKRFDTLGIPVGDPGHGHVTDCRLRERQCARVGAVCLALSTAGARTDRRAGSADGRAAHHRALRGGHRACRSTRHRVPVRGPTNFAGDRASQRRQPAREPEALEGQFLLRTGVFRIRRGRHGMGKTRTGRRPSRPFTSGGMYRKVHGPNGGGITKQ